MLLGKCKKCAEQFYGWLLTRPEYQYCPKCGGPLIVNDDNGDIKVDKEDLLELDKEYIKEWPK
ncbi:hypothetical protein ACFLUH_00390 [Chloroflexota bacterium]